MRLLYIKKKPQLLLESVYDWFYQRDKKTRKFIEKITLPELLVETAEF